MKLLIVTNLFPNAAEPTRGLYSLQQAQALARSAEVTVIAPVPWSPPLPRLRWLRRWRPAARMPFEETIQGLRVFHPRYAVCPKIGRRWDAASFAQALRPVVKRLLAERRFDAVFATWAYPDVAGTVRLASILQAPIVAGVLGSDIHVYATGWRGRRIAEALGACRAVVCVSEALRQATAALGVAPERLHVVPNGVDTARFQLQSRAACRAALGLPADRPLLLCLGHLVPVKGPDVLLEAAAILHRQCGPGPRPLLAFVGEGEQADALQRRARELGLEADVRFVGAVPHERVPLWLGACELLCVPSRQEGCPNVVLEALACGRPIIGTRVGGLPELVREPSCGTLVPSEDPAALAAALQAAVARPWDEAAIRASVRGGWDENARTILQLCETARQPTVLHVLRYSIPNLSGYTMRSQALIEGQRRLGLRPVVVTSTRHAAEADRESLNGIVYERCRLSRQPLLRWLQTAIPLVRDLATMHVLRRRIEAVARSTGADLIHAHSPVMCGLPALIAARRLRVPLLYEVRALWEDAAVDQEKTTEGAAAYRLLRAVETFVLRRADRIVVICGGLKQELIQRGIAASKIAVVPNGVNTADFPPLRGKDAGVLQRYGLNGQVTIGFIGSLFQFEGLDSLLAAVPHLRRQQPGVKVLIVGAGEQEPALRRAADAAGLGGSVIFTGRVPHEQVHAYYSVMDVLVYPRLSRRITELVTPLKPLEAMALGRPVVASDVGGLRELVTDGETGLLFKAGDPQDLAAKCLRVATDRALAERLTRQARAYVEGEREWTTSCAAAVALYHDVLGAVR